MKILVVTDIHACASDQPGALQRSYVHAGQGVSSSPTEEFIDLIKRNSDCRPDVVVCCGDMGDQANPTGLQHAWNFLNELVKLSPASLLLATAGNHDLDSRFQHSDYDAKGTLQDLNPPFPLVCLDDSFLSKKDIERKALHFWADNFYVVVKDTVRFVVLNSSAFHGYGKISENTDLLEYEHGRISEFTIKRMTKVLQEQNEKLEGGSVIINVLICHHHLEKDGSVDDPDYSSMRGAHTLVDMLSDSDIGRWLVIHGHRHRPRLYQTNDSTGPFVLSAASFGATKFDDPQNPSPNQAYLINLDLREMKKCRFLPAGSIKTFSRAPGMAWSNTYYASGGLPPNSNFGFRGSVDELAADINDTIIGETPVKWVNLSEKIPKISYLHYKQLDELNKCLKRYSMVILFDDCKTPTSCGRKL
jgi:predicted phosphodiesterase